MEQTVIMWVTVLGFAIVVTRAVLAAPLIAQLYPYAVPSGLPLQAKTAVQAGTN